MAIKRRTALAVLLAGIALIAAVTLRDLMATIFFAITVAYVLVPLHEWLHRQGLPPWWASAGATVIAFVGLLALFAPIAVLLYLRRRQLIAVLTSLPDRFVVEVGELSYVVEMGDLTAFATRYLTATALDLAAMAPVLAVQTLVFAFLVFALVLKRSELRRALLAPIPTSYHDVVLAFHERTRMTLRALYVLQATTAVGTFLLAIPVFWALGYEFVVTLAVIAGILQFLPVIGPSVLILVLAAGEALAGGYEQAVIVTLVGWVVIAVLPDALIRPRLARETVRLPSSLYFVGFAGGLLSLGPVGIIAGPLIVALLVESLSLLAAEVRANRLAFGSAEEVKDR